MATLVLTSIGTLIGGPVGGAIGALLGQSVDARLFAPKGRSGPRLTDLKVQTSSYGTAIPRLYGRMRVAGTVIWATDLVEHGTRQGGGKGRPSVTTYSYSASFAVALSSRPIAGIGRIWAEGNLLRGAAGDFKSATGFRLYDGAADQPVDPLIAAAVGLDACPAYRGIAYVVFDDMDLAPFGNRIPSLTFEVIADTAPATLALPMTDLTGSLTVNTPLPPIAGAIVTDVSAADWLTSMERIVMLSPLAGGTGWQAGTAADAPVTITEPADDAPRPRMRRARISAGSSPAAIAVLSYDPARDYQLSVQQARIASTVTGADAADDIALPLALEASAAKSLALHLASEAAASRETLSLPAGFAALAAPPGSTVSANGAPYVVHALEISGAAVRLTLHDIAPASPAAVGDSGMVARAPDAPAGDSVGAVFDVPMMAADRESRLVLAATGTGTGWRGCAVRLSAANGDGPFVDVGTAGPVRVLGHVSAIAASADNHGEVIDRASAIEVTLIRADMLLANADDDALLAGANMAMAGGEVLQFGHAEPLAPGRWRLTRLLRGRMGTEDRIAALTMGAPFTLLDDPALLELPNAAGLAPVRSGGAVALLGNGDAAPVIVTIDSTGRAGMPLRPAHLDTQWQDDGALTISWTPRSRLGFDWPDLRDTPPDDAGMIWRVALAAGASAQQHVTPLPALTLDSATIADLRAAGPLLSIAVTQVGPHGLSPPAVLTIPL